MDYQKAYALLVGSISKAIDEINKSPASSREIERGLDILKGCLLKAEEMYVGGDE